MKNPTNKDIEEAKAYLRERLSAEISMRNNLETLLVNAAEEIVAISEKYNIPPSKFKFSYNSKLKKEVGEVLKNLRDLLEDYTLTLSVATHEENKEKILSFITGDRYGSTLKERIKKLVTEYRGELETAIAASLLKDAAKDNVITVAKDSRPQRSLERLTRHTIAEGWMYNWWFNANEKGAIGFRTFRGSSYPCQMCSDYTMYLHPMDDPFPPLHPHCVCGMVFVYE